MLSQAPKLHISEQHKSMMLDIIQHIAPNSEIWAYGSRVCNNDSPNIFAGTDLDLVILGNNPPLIALKNAFADCNIPFMIDIIAMQHTPKSVQAEIHKKSIKIFPNL